MGYRLSLYQKWGIPQNPPYDKEGIAKQGYFQKKI